MTGGRFESIAALEPYAIFPGAVARAVHGARLTLAVIDLEPGCAVPEHDHHNEQLGVVIRGSVTMVIEGESRILHAGETYFAPAGVPHAATAGEGGATVVDVFSPARADWEALTRLEPSPGRWPESTVEGVDGDDQTAPVGESRRPPSSDQRPGEEVVQVNDPYTGGGPPPEHEPSQNDPQHPTGG